MKTIFTGLLIFFGLACYSQDAVYSDDLMIYEKLLSLYDHGSPLLLESETSSQTLKRFDFKNPGNHQLKPDSLDKAWRNFLNGIDTSVLHNSLINSSLRKKYPLKKQRNGRLIYLSPIIFSRDKMKAVCAVKDYGSGEDASEEVYLLEKKQKRWIIIKFYLISIS
jgi:hypothetical protein